MFRLVPFPSKKKRAGDTGEFPPSPGAFFYSACRKCKLKSPPILNPGADKPYFASSRISSLDILEGILTRNPRRMRSAPCAS